MCLQQGLLRTIFLPTRPQDGSGQWGTLFAWGSRIDLAPPPSSTPNLPTPLSNGRKRAIRVRC